MYSREGPVFSSRAQNYAIRTDLSPAAIKFNEPPDTAPASVRCKPGEHNARLEERTSENASILLAEAVGRTTYAFFEQPAEMLGIEKAQRIGNLTDALPAAEQHLLGEIDDFILYILLRRATGLFFHQVAEIAGERKTLSAKYFTVGNPFLAGSP